MMRHFLMLSSCKRPRLSCGVAVLEAMGKLKDRFDAQ